MMFAFEPLVSTPTRGGRPGAEKPLQLIEATFVPRRRESLRPEAARYVGWRGQWQALWQITDEDGGDYVGQTMWMPRDGWPWFGWAPDEDLADPKPV